MPQREPGPSESPEVTHLLLAHEIAKLVAAGEEAGRATLDPDAYLETFGKIYRGIAAIVHEPHPERPDSEAPSAPPPAPGPA